jgi:flagellar hook-length control protein FliK
MAASVSVHINTMSPGETGKPVSSPNGHAFAGGFAALLSGLLHKESSSRAGSPLAAKTDETSTPHTDGERAAAPGLAAPCVVAPSPKAVTAESQNDAVASVQTEEAIGPREAVAALAAEGGNRETVGAAVIPAPIGPVPTGKDHEGKARAHVIGGKAKEAASDLVQPRIDPTVAGIVLTAPDLSLPAPAAPEPKAQLPTSEAGAAAAAVPHVAESGAVKEHHADPSATQDEKLTQRDRSDPAAPLETPGVDYARPERPALKVDQSSDVSGLSARSDIAQTISSGTETSPLSILGPAQPAQSPNRTTPTDQVAPAVIGIMKAMDGTQSVTVRLQPPELGQVEIRVDRTVDGAAHVDITTERPETLQLLQRDQPRLEQALDQAGILSTGRTVSFQVASPEQVGASASRPDSMSAGSGDSGQSQSGGAWRQRGDSQSDPNGNRESSQQQARTRWFRAGLDITA